eukprot:TRINITY_DN4801_c0_g1_i2.p1 TRINITY_DN4801_c0_g1~~TRINITY_DN4801_c0_g1_i2.p1  ORF type:complete len:520 (-),score=81.17 TRINITY_DN4801_c0_g1_i2:357-1916(-)
MWAPEEDNRKPLLSAQEGHGKAYAHDPNFHGVDKGKRSCNDIIFAILFIAMFAAMLVISSVAFSKGNPQLLLPSNSPQYIDQYGPSYVEGRLQDAVASLKQDRNILIWGVLSSIFLGVAWIQLMKTFTKAFVYISLFLGIAGVAGLGVYFLTLGMKQNNSSINIVAYVLFGLAFLFALLLIFLKKKIALTCAMFTETCKGVQHSPTLFVSALLTIALFVAFVVYWTFSFIYLYSIPDKNVEFTGPSDIPHPPTFNTSVRNLMYFMIFGFLWTSAFLSAVFQHSVAGAIACWYFGRDSSNGANRESGVGSPAVVSFFQAFTTSFGSLAFGSLVIAIVEFLEFLLRQSKKANAQNKLLVFIISCLQCVLGCIEGIVQWINKFAYIYVAMHGYSFCKSARGCFELISRNAFTAVIMDLIGSFVLLMGKLFFTAVSVAITVGLLQHYDRPLTSVPLILVAIGSFLILHITGHIIGVGVDTVFVCYLEDLERNKDGNVYMSPELHNMLQEKAEAAKNSSVSHKV